MSIGKRQMCTVDQTVMVHHQAARHTWRTWVLLQFSSFFFFFFRHLTYTLRARWTELNRYMLGSKLVRFTVKMHVRNLGYILPLQIGVQNHVFRRLHNVTATLTASIFVTKHDIGLHNDNYSVRSPWSDAIIILQLILDPQNLKLRYVKVIVSDPAILLVVVVVLIFCALHNDTFN